MASKNMTPVEIGARSITHEAPDAPTRYPAFPLSARLLRDAAAFAARRRKRPQQATQRRAKAPRPAYNLSGYPPAVRDGYIDGCETAKKSEYGRKDEKRFARRRPVPDGLERRLLDLLSPLT